MSLLKLQGEEAPPAEEVGKEGVNVKVQKISRFCV